MVPQNRTSPASPPRKRRRPATSCEQCRRRKVRCDLQIPCRACQQARGTLTCTYKEETLRPRQTISDVRVAEGKSDMPASTLTEGAPEDLSMTTLSGLEPRAQGIQHLFLGLESTSYTRQAQLNVASTDFNGSNTSLLDLSNRLRKAEQQLSELTRVRQSFVASGNLTIPTTVPRLRNTADKTKLFGSTHWVHTAEQIDCSQIDSTDMELGIGDMKAELADMVKECRSLRQSAKSQRSLQLNEPVPDLFSTFPERHVCDELASAYIRTFEQTYRIMHIPSFWRDYYRFWESPHSASMPFVIQLSLILSIGVAFFPNLGESTRLRHLAQTWIYAAQWWLVGPSEKSTRNLDGIQVFCLLLVSRQTNPIGASPWLSTGSLLRMALTMGLHRDPRVFPNLTPFHAEMRARLWTTTLELVVHASVDSSSMPLMISSQTFNDHLPRNINDADLEPNLKELPTPKPLKQFTESSIQLVMRQSLETRMDAARLINNPDSVQSYEAALHLATDLQKACRDLAAYFQLHWSQSSAQTDLHQKFLDMQLRRYILLLHRPYMLQARQDPRFYLSRKICVESAMVIASYAENIKLPSEVLDDLSRLMIMSTGPFCGALHLDIITVLGLEVISQLKEANTGPSETGQLIIDPLGEMAKAQRRPIIRILEHINEQLLQVVALGIPRFKRYIFLTGILCQIDALENGKSNARPLMIKAIQEGVRKCYSALQASQTVNTPETLICTDTPPGLDFDFMDPNLDFSTFFAHFGGIHDAGL
ncbi:hypothetical protein BBP40_012099 [Aspergillus hancockii]|nr:hypothetical protein BBP40_012099 [Aspergillus hancockii]